MLFIAHRRELVRQQAEELIADAIAGRIVPLIGERLWPRGKSA